jgi:mannosyltransferase OCH1-like enzyme
MVRKPDSGVNTPRSKSVTLDTPRGLDERYKLPLLIESRVMQTYKSQDEIPDHWLQGQASVKKQLSHFEYTLLSDSDMHAFVVKYFPHYLTQFIALEHKIMQVDVIRYMYLYERGGLYLDLDYEMTSDLSLYLRGGDLFLLPSANSSSKRVIFTNAVMASRAKHPFWLDVLKECFEPGTPISSWTNELYILERTGPNMLTRVALRYRHNFVTLPKSLIQPYSVCDSCNSFKNSVLIPLQGSSWMSGTRKTFYHTAYCHPYWTAVILIIIFIIFMFFLCWLFATWRTPSKLTSRSRSNLDI